MPNRMSVQEGLEALNFNTSRNALPAPPQGSTTGDNTNEYKDESLDDMLTE